MHIKIQDYTQDTNIQYKIHCNMQRLLEEMQREYKKIQDYNTRYRKQRYKQKKE